MQLLATLVAALFAVLSFVHVYWALGGRAWLGKVVPSRDGRPVFVPGRVATGFVAGVLAVFALFAVVLGFGEPDSLVVRIHFRAAGLVVGVLLVLRAVGEFRYLGFFKQIREGDFARLDSWLYSPLCLLSGGAYMLLAWGW